MYKEVSTGAPIINLKYYKPTNPAGRSFIPVEFAVAAYRFGHSMTRPRYTVRDVFDSTGNTVLGSVSGVPLFQDTPTDNNLNGHRELLPRLKIQWSKFFNVAGQTPTARPVRQFDASLANPLFKLPTDGAARHQHSRSAVAAESPPRQEDGPALRTAGGSADGRDASHQPSCGRITVSRWRSRSSATW